MKVNRFQVLGYSLIFFLLSTIHCNLYPAFAADATPSARPTDIGYSRIGPASPLYFLKTVRENLEMKLAKTQRVKELRRLEFATRRLRETKSLIGKNEDLVPPTLERYIAHLNSLTDKHLKNDPFADELKNNLAIHVQVLQQIYDSLSSLRAKMAVRSAMNRVIQRADVSNSSKAFVCLLFASEASSSALNQTEQMVLKDRAKKCQEQILGLP